MTVDASTALPRSDDGDLVRLRPLLVARARPLRNTRPAEESVTGTNLPARAESASADPRLAAFRLEDPGATTSAIDTNLARRAVERALSRLQLSESPLTTGAERAKMLARTVTEAFVSAVEEAVSDHHGHGRSVVVYRDGKLFTIKPSQRLPGT
jgi:hypothetical protein